MTDGGAPAWGTPVPVPDKHGRRAKLDPRARATVDDGGPDYPVDVLVALQEPLTAAVRHELETAGLTRLSGSGTVVAGHVPDRATLDRLLAVEAVRQVELPRPLSGEDA